MARYHRAGVHAGEVRWMATEAVAAGQGSSAIEATGRPYARSWIDVVFGWMSALPGPTWLAYLVLIIPSVALANSALWLSGWGSCLC